MIANSSPPTRQAMSAARQEGSLAGLTCRRDALPQPGEVELAGYLPFLALS